MSGRHRIVMEYYENGGGALARLSFASSSSGGNSPSSPPTTGNSSPSSSCSQVGSNFFVGCYYNDRNLTNFATSQSTGRIDFDWGNGSPDSAVSSHNFSARWQGDFDLSSGQYDFVVTADDGVRLYVDGELILDRWIDQPPTTYAVSRTLSAGRHRIVMEYYENGGGAVARLSFASSSSGGSSPSSPPTTGNSSPSSSCSQVGSNFFVGCYYNDRNLTNFATSQSTGRIDFDWGNGSPDSAVSSDNFSARWQGDFDLSSGQYDFVVTADDGVRLYVDGELILDRWIDQPPTTYTVSRTLMSGRHRIVMEYYENGEGALARLSW
jgi:hypothetical protein